MSTDVASLPPATVIPPRVEADGSTPALRLDGSASLERRRSYLRERRGEANGGRSMLPVWIAVGMVLLWLSVIGFVGIDR